MDRPAGFPHWASSAPSEGPPTTRSVPLTVLSGAVPRTTFEQRAAWPTILVSMPFMDIDRPSIQLGLLKAIADAYGFPLQTVHANLDFAGRIGVGVYRPLCHHRGRLLGDWLFSVEAFGDSAPDH